MVRLIISGCNGRMGRVVETICSADPEFEIVAGFDLLGAAGDRDFPIYSSPSEFQGQADVVVDFSSPAALDALLEFGLQRRLPLVLATTGYSEQQLLDIDRAAGAIPIFRSANMSLGVNVLLQLVRSAVAKGYGRSRIRQILYEKSIPQEYWEDALSLVPEMDEAIDRFLERRFRGNAPEEKEIKRAVDALLRRGHSYSDIRAGLQRYDESLELDDAEL